MSEIVRREVQSGTRVGDELPKIGEYYWIRYTEEPYDSETGKRGPEVEKEALACVSHIASNHVQFHDVGTKEYGGETYSVAFDDLMRDTRLEPDWKSILEGRLDQLRLEMQAASEKLRDDAVAIGALPPADTECRQTDPNSMLPAIRTMDPVKHKRDLVQLKEQLPEIIKSIEAISVEYAMTAKKLMYPQLAQLYQYKDELGVLEDKIFTLEVYAGLQELVMRIRKGKTAPIDTKITVRQAMLYMDEETLFDWDKGGLDFSTIHKFDKWIALPETIARILPEPKGIVAFRVRRHEKDYGMPSTLAEAWAQAKWHKQNLETYLVIRNGENIYRIASEVSFAPRLVPLRDEFEGGFKRVKTGWYNFEKRERDPDIVERVTPADFDYDKHAKELQDRLKHYNRIIVLIQGLLDRSEVFHPHEQINLAADFERWLDVVRDEEDGLDDGSETWAQYKTRLNAIIVEGVNVYTGDYRDPRRRGYHDAGMPLVCPVFKLRLGAKKDIVPDTSEGYGRAIRYFKGRSAEECVGKLGVEVKWPTERMVGGSWRRHNETKIVYLSCWIPIERVFNVDAYQVGDFKKFAGHRREKQSYATWSRAVFTAEKFKLGLLKPREQRSWGLSEDYD